MQERVAEESNEQNAAKDRAEVHSSGSLKRAFVWCVVAYLVALVVAVGVGFAMRSWGPLWMVVWADLAATLAIFCFSVAFRNSSFYDAYWSVAPMVIVVFWALHPASHAAIGLRQVLVVALMWAWGARLTFNWARHWDGLKHEDWRYVNIRKQTGIFYWPVCLLGIHIFPTVQVFLGCLALYPALVSGSRPFGLLDIVACVVTASAIVIEAAADQQLRAFSLSERKPEDILESGLWAYSRHPNYFGEMMFWWGLCLFGLASAPFAWWIIAGGCSISLMFAVVSIPLIERRMLEKRPHYAEQRARISAVIPWFPKRSSRV